MEQHSPEIYLQGRSMEGVARSHPSTILLTVTTRMGWKIYGERLGREAKKNKQDSVCFYPFTPWAWGRRISWQTGYSDNTLPHLRLFDPFTLMKCQVACTPQLWGSYRAALVATQGVASGILHHRPKLPVFLIVDATRLLYRDEFGAQHITDEDIEEEASVFRRCSHIFALSTWAATSIKQCAGLTARNITVVPPISFESNRPLKERGEGIGRSERLKILFVGRDFKRKGGALLLEWQREALCEFVDLRIVTEEQHFDFSVPNTTWFGPLSNDSLIQDVMRDVDLLIHPTQKDCSAIVVVEGAMRGLPAIASSIGGISDLVDHGVTGYLIKPNNRGDFIESIHLLFHNRKLLRMLGENARLKAEREFGAECIYRKLITTVKRSVGI